MSRATRQRDAVAPSLFPFLAVLLCTMGALVLILMLIVSGAQASALHVADESEKQAEEVESQLQAARHGFKKQLDAGRIVLEKKRLALQHLENHIQEIMTELEELQRTGELADAKAATDAAALEAQAAAISELEKQLLASNEKLKQKLDKPEGDKPIFAIIPYDGPNGTHRRPIYLECVPEGVRIQPEGLLIRTADLEPPYGPGNPLDAALRTIRAHYVPANHAVTSTAYPLLIVRPSGIRSYAMARAAMSGWDDQFGYELVGEELELIFPEGEPGLTQKVAQTLDLARARQAALIMAMPQKYREFAQRGGGLGGEPLSGGAGSGPGGGDVVGGGSAGDSGSWSGSEQSAAASSRGGWADGRPAGESLAQSLAGHTADGSNGANTSPGNSGSPHGSSAGGGQLGFGNAAQPQLDFDAARAGASEGQSFAANSSNSGSGGAPGDSFFGSGAAEAGQSGYTGGGAANDPSLSGMFDGSSGGSGTSSGSSHGQSSGPSTTAAASNNSASGAAGGSSSGGATNLSGSQMAVPFSAPSGSAGASSAGTSGGQTSSGQTSAGSSSQSASLNASNQDGSPPPDAQGMPQIAVNQSLNSQRGSGESTTAVASRKGRGWAWSQGPPTQTSVVRAIRMQCLADRWVVLADSAKSGQASTTIAFEDSPQQRAEQLAKVVAERVDQWGIALTGGYWKPVLEVEVAADAEWRFHQLQQLLASSGLDVQRVPTKK